MPEPSAVTQPSLDVLRAADEALDTLLDLDDASRRRALDDLPRQVRNVVSRMLAVQDQSSILDLSPTDLLEGLGGGDASAEDRCSSSGLVGRRFGPFELQEEIGRGGMAVVFRAARVDGDYQQDVAIKLLTVGELAAGGGQRFGQEAQVLARLRHPAIATLLDAGVADDGTPWLAMELVDGVRIDRWCADRELDARAVVGLLLQVADAVSAAHRQLVVHRDLKPGNVLVDRDGRARLLDFGIAKLVDERGGSEATSTRVLTPEYGAPEQLVGEPVSTATDVHGLGALLFRLLAGEPPFERQEMGLGTERRLRAMRSAAAPVVGIDRDLERVVGKALREEPERRYATAAEFAADLRNWLELRPVSAAPDSLGYRLRKLMRRRRGGVLAAAAVSLAVLLGVVGTLWQARRVAEESRRTALQAARADAVSEFLRDLFTSAAPDEAQGREVRVVEALEIGARRVDAELKDVPEVRAEVLATIAAIYRSLGLYSDALAVLDRLGEMPRDDAVGTAVRLERSRALKELDRFEEAKAELDELSRRREENRLGGVEQEIEYLVTLAEVNRITGDYEQAQSAFQEAVDVGEREDAVGLPSINARLGLAAVAYETGEFDRADAAYQRVFEVLDRVTTGDHSLRAHTLFAHGVLLSELRRDDEAIEELVQAKEMYGRLLGERHHEVADVLTEIATVHGVAGRLDAAEEAQREAYDILVEQQGPTHRDTLQLRNSIGLLAYRRGNPEAAIEELREVVRLMAETYGPEHPVRSEVLVNLGAILRIQRQFDEALQTLQEAERLLLAKFGEAHGAVAHSRSHLGGVYQALGDLDQALLWYRRALGSARQAVGESHPQTLTILLNAAMVRFQQGAVEEASALGEEALAGFEEVLAGDDVLLDMARVRVTRLRAADGRPQEAMETIDRAESALVDRLGESHPRVREARMARGEALLAAGRRDEARRALELALADLPDSLEWEHEDHVRQLLSKIGSGGG